MKSLSMRVATMSATLFTPHRMTAVLGPILMLLGVANGGCSYMWKSNDSGRPVTVGELPREVQRESDVLAEKAALAADEAEAEQQAGDLKLAAELDAARAAKEAADLKLARLEAAADPKESGELKAAQVTKTAADLKAARLETAAAEAKAARVAKTARDAEASRVAKPPLPEKATSGAPELESYAMPLRAPSKQLQCERFVDGAQTYQGHQMGWGMAAGVAALATGTLAVALANDDEGGFWEENRKYVFLVPTTVLVPLAINFFNNASAAGRAASQAQAALGEKDIDKLHAACVAARAAYFDDRVAAVQEARTQINNEAADVKELKKTTAKAEAETAKAAAEARLAALEAEVAKKAAAAVDAKVEEVRKRVEAIQAPNRR